MFMVAVGFETAGSEREGGGNPIFCTDVVPTNRAVGAYENRLKTIGIGKIDEFTSLWLYYQDRCTRPARRETSMSVPWIVMALFSSTKYFS